MFPELAFKPDMMWAFNKDRKLLDSININNFSSITSFRIDLSTVSQVIILEIIEVSRKIHTNNRHITDENREEQIRTVLGKYNIKVGFVYVTIAAINHKEASECDRFFKKNQKSGEYMIIQSKKSKWKKRVLKTLEALECVKSSDKFKTIKIGN